MLALLFAVRLIMAAFEIDFSPFASLSFGDDYALQAWLLAGLLVVLGLLVWLVLRHGDEAVWLASAEGGVLVPTDDLERHAAAAAVRSHPDVVRAEVELGMRGGAFRARARVWARPLANAAATGASVEDAVRGRLTRLTGRDVDKLKVTVRVLTVSQLPRYLP